MKTKSPRGLRVYTLSRPSQRELTIWCWILKSIYFVSVSCLKISPENWQKKLKKKQFAKLKFWKAKIQKWGGNGGSKKGGIRESLAGYFLDFSKFDKMFFKIQFQSISTPSSPRQPLFFLQMNVSGPGYKAGIDIVVEGAIERKLEDVVLVVALGKSTSVQHELWSVNWLNVSNYLQLFR